MTVKKSRQVRKFLDKQNELTRKRLDDALSNLPGGDVVPVVNAPNTFRLRVGKYRALFIVDEGVVKVTLLDVRGQIYKKG